MTPAIKDTEQSNQYQESKEGAFYLSLYQCILSFSLHFENNYA